MSEKYTCAVWHEEFTKGFTEEEARAELEVNFPGAKPEDCDLVCDGCFKEHFPELALDG